MTGLIILTVLVVLAIAAPRYGVDTRTSDSWNVGGAQVQPRRAHSVRSDLAALGRVLSRFAQRTVASH
jgi:hypothetical protein